MCIEHDTPNIYGATVEIHSQKRLLNPPFINISDRLVYIFILLTCTKSEEWPAFLNKPIGVHHFVFIYAVSLAGKMLSKSYTSVSQSNNTHKYEPMRLQSSEPIPFESATKQRCDKRLMQIPIIFCKSCILAMLLSFVSAKEYFYKIFRCLMQNRTCPIASSF